MLSKLFGWGKKESVKPHHQVSLQEAFAFLKTDMHSHLLPGIDDGAPTIEESLMLIRSLMDMGYRRFITTPHIKSDIYPNTPVTIGNALKDLRQALAAHDMNVDIHAAAEYYIDDCFADLLESGEPMLTLNKNEILVEFSFMFEPMRLPQTIFNIQTKGYKPVFAHPERYSFFHHKPEVFEEIKNRGGLLQLNTLSLSGYYGKPVKDMADKLLHDGLYDYLGTDLHHDKHVTALHKFIQSKSYTQLVDYPFLNSRLAD